VVSSGTATGQELIWSLDSLIGVFMNVPRGADDHAPMVVRSLPGARAIHRKERNCQGRD